MLPSHFRGKREGNYKLVPRVFYEPVLSDEELKNVFFSRNVFFNSIYCNYFVSLDSHALKRLSLV